MSKSIRLHGLVAASHTPFKADGSLNLDVVELQAKHYVQQGIKYAFITGSTAESSSLQLAERLEIMAAWKEAMQKHDVKVVVHVGSNSVRDAAELAAASQKMGMAAVSALSPSYFKPGSIDLLVDCCKEIAAAAPELPFYYYDIPALTNVNFQMPSFIEKAKSCIPNFAGIKFTNPNLAMYAETLAVAGDDFDIPWGVDEMYLGAMATGAQGAVGSSFNFAPNLYHSLIDAFNNGDIAAARLWQRRSVEMINIIAANGYMGTAKAIMGWHGVPVGPARLPMSTPSADSMEKVRCQLEAIGFFEWALH